MSIDQISAPAAHDAASANVTLLLSCEGCDDACLHAMTERPNGDTAFICSQCLTLTLLVPHAPVAYHVPA